MLAGGDGAERELVIFGYGYSGSGKTYTLLGKDNTDGILQLILKKTTNNTMSKIEIYEDYGKLKEKKGKGKEGDGFDFKFEVAKREITLVYNITTDNIIKQLEDILVK